MAPTSHSFPYPNRDTEIVELATNIMFAVAAMELSTNADSTDAVN